MHQSKFYVQSASGSEEHDDEGLLYYHRKQRGVNLGSWFVIERWITDSPFRCASAPAQSDLDIAKGSHAKEILEHHWDSWITAQDFEWLAAKGINTVRVPIGYYHLCGLDNSILCNTDFHGLEYVFDGAWPRIVSATETAKRYGIGVLFDLHAAPGKQNEDSHSGTSSPVVSFFQSKSNPQLTIRVLCMLVSALRSLRRNHDPPLSNVVGIEVLNEPKPPSHSALQEWYADAIRELRSLDPSLPIYISDAWWPDAYADFAQKLPRTMAPICIDHHLYRCFTGGDISTPAAQHTASFLDPNSETPQTFSRVVAKLEETGGALIVGEWSGGLNPGSLCGPINEHDERTKFIQAQLDLFERHCAGWFFWTYKKERSGDLGWSFRDVFDAGLFPGRVGLFPVKPVPRDPNEWAARKAIRHEHAAGRHRSYWTRYQGHYEHWRFDRGYNQGWEDAYYFLTARVEEHGGSVCELGFKGFWNKKRVGEHAVKEGSSGNLWEFAWSRRIVHLSLPPQNMVINKVWTRLLPISGIRVVKSRIEEFSEC